MTKKNIVKFISKVGRVFLGDVNRHAEAGLEAHVAGLREAIRDRQPENIVQYGYSIYSQNEEDGIIDHILNKIDVNEPKFIEFGVHAHENNTLALVLKGGRGAWVDKGLEGFARQCPENQKLLIIADFVTKLNIVEICNKCSKHLGLSDFGYIDLMCLDLDGNDFHLIKEVLMAGLYPKLFCLEYNAKFPPPLRVAIDYNEKHTWDNNDDFYGVSLQQYVDLLSSHGYVLVTCNLSGSNAFFVRKEYGERFKYYSTEELYQPPRPFLSPFPKGCLPSTKFLLQELRRSAS